MKITTSRQQPTSRQIALTAGDLRSLPPEKLKQVLSELGQNKAEELRYLWPFWARQEQLEPEGDWNIWLALAGRGWGKTKNRVAAVAPTYSDIRRVMVEGESGFLNVCWKGDKTHRGGKMGFPVWSPTNRTLTWESGAKVEFYSAVNQG